MIRLLYRVPGLKSSVWTSLCIVELGLITCVSPLVEIGFSIPFFPDSHTIDIAEMSADHADSDLAKLKGYYLCGIIHSGFSEESLRNFLDVEKRAQISTWTLNQLIDAGQEFVRKNKTEREVALEASVSQLTTQLAESQRLLKSRSEELSKSFRSGFLDGVLSDSTFSFPSFCKFLLKRTTTPVDSLPMDDLKAHVEAYREAERPILTVDRGEGVSVVYEPPLPPVSPSKSRKIPEPMPDPDLEVMGNKYRIEGKQAPRTQLLDELEVKVDVSP